MHHLSCRHYMHVSGQVHSPAVLTRGPHNRVQHCGVQSTDLPLPGIEPGSWSPKPVAVSTTLTHDVILHSLREECQLEGQFNTQERVETSSASSVTQPGLLALLEDRCHKSHRLRC